MISFASSLSGEGFLDEDLLWGLGEGARELDLLGGLDPGRDGDGARDPGRLPGLEPGREGEGALELVLLAGLEGGREGPLEEGREDLDGPEIEEFLELCLDPSYLTLKEKFY